MENRHYKTGNTFDGWSYEFDFDLSGVLMEMDFKTSPNTRPAFRYSTADGTLLIENRVVSMVPRILNCPAGTYYHDIKVTMPTGEVDNHDYDSIKIIQVIT